MLLRKLHASGGWLPILLMVFTLHASGTSVIGFDVSQTQNKPILGVWKCTPKTALQFPEGILEPVILISEDGSHDLTVRGCFLWNGQFYDVWELKNMQFNESTHILSFRDSDNDAYRGTLDPETGTITGFVHSGDPGNEVPADRLDFTRSDPTLANRFFYPRMPDSDGNIRYIYRVPETLEDGLETASLLEVISDLNAFSDLMDHILRLDYGHLESLLIIRDGRLVLEEYFYGNERSMTHNIHSCTKSVISLLLGMSMEKHDSLNADLPLVRFFPAYRKQLRGEKGKITLKNLLTMTSGLDTEDLPDLPSSEKQIKAILALPLYSNPGIEFRYCNDCSQLLGWVIHSLSGMQPDSYAAEHLFEPLGISEYVWETDHGIPHAYSDLHLLPRDMAKIGLLVLQDGFWKGKQIVPREWIRESTRPYVSESKYFNYGFHWWYRSKNNLPWWKEPGTGTETEHNKVIALGSGGQYIFIIRELDLVITTTASDYGTGERARSKVPMVVEEIEPLFENAH